MNIVCLDMEGVLVPEIWLELAEKTEIAELKFTTRDIANYDKLMKKRIEVIQKHNIKLSDIQNVIEDINPLEGAKQFLDKLRKETQVIILSDTFEQFAKPLLKKLNWPTLFCNTLVIDSNDNIVDYSMRCTPSKLTTIKSLQSCGYETIGAGDSLNDIGMLQNSKAGFLFKSSPEIEAQYPNIPAYHEYEELYTAIKNALTD